MRRTRQAVLLACFAPKYLLVCRWCGRAFPSRHRSQFCGRNCRANAWRAAHGEAWRAYRRRWHRAALADPVWAARDRAYQRAYLAAWQRRNPEKVRAYTAAYRARALSRSLD